MIIKGGKEIVRIFYRGKEAQTLVNVGKIVFEAIRSCFGSGAWFNNKGWLNSEGWKN